MDQKTRYDIQVASRDLSHFLLEKRLLAPKEGERATHTLGQPVAIIGAGPAGLSAANILAQLGYQVTVFEALSVIGGMLSVGIPFERRPGGFVEQLLAIARQPGIDVQLQVTLGQDLSFQQLQQQFVATLLAVGLQQSVPLCISGEDVLQGVIPALHFLKQYHLRQSAVRGDVAVIGGGIATMDVARLAVRAGAHSVRVFLSGPLSDLPALAEERAAAQHEGIRFHPYEMPASILGTEDVNVHAVRCQNTLKPATPVVNGRPFVFILGTDHWYFVDTVLVAFAEVADLSCVPCINGHFLHPRGARENEGRACTTNLPGVFVAGDVAGGPCTLLHAFTSGYEAAHAIHQYLCGQQGTCRPQALPALR